MIDHLINKIQNLWIDLASKEKYLADTTQEITQVFIKDSVNKEPSAVSVPDYKLSEKAVEGLNHLKYPQPFKINSRHNGVIVNFNKNTFIVSLKNGYYGWLSAKYMSKLNETNGTSIELKIGDEVSVSVLKVGTIFKDGVFAIYLGVSEFEDAKWDRTVLQNPVGKLVGGFVTSKTDEYYYINLSSGILGMLSYSEKDKIDIPMWVNLKVIAHLSRALLLSTNLSGVDIRQVPDLNVGKKYKGVVYKKLKSGFLIKLPNRFFGLLNKVNLKDQSELVVGDKVQVEVVQHCFNSMRFYLALVEEGVQNPPFYASFNPDEGTWEKIKEKYPIGTTVEGQITHSHEKQQPHISNVFLKDGVSGYLKDKELSWSKNLIIDTTLFVPGKLLNLKVIGYIENKRKLKLGYRHNLIHPLDDPTKCPKIGEIFIGTVRNIKDYGIFVDLPFEFDGLLHNSQLPDSFAITLGQKIEVVLIEIDIKLRRITLGLPQNL